MVIFTMTVPFPTSPFPERLTLELTSRCNLGCLFCPRHQTDMTPGDMSETLFQRIVDEAAGQCRADAPPVALALFFRGESLLHPRLGAMIRYAKERGLGPLQLASNGFLLTPALGAELLAAGLDFISFSLDTNDDEIYAQTRLGSDLSLARANVQAFIQQAWAFEKAAGHRPEIQVSSVEVPDYQAGQAAFIDFWRGWADKVRIYVEHSADGHFGSLNQALTGQAMERKPCRKVHTDLVVYWDGRAALCNHDWQNDFALGDLTRQTVAEVWRSPAYTRIRMAHESGLFPTGLVCGGCDHWRMYYSQAGFLGRCYDKYAD